MRFSSQYRRIATSLAHYIENSHYRIIALLEYRYIALSQYRIIAILQYRNIAGAWHMIIFVNMFSAKCDLRYAPSHIGSSKFFNVSGL